MLVFRAWKGPNAVVLLALAIFFAVFVHSFVGFGFGLMVTPPLVSLVGLQTAVPLVTVVGTVFQLLMLTYYRTSLDLRTIIHLCAGAALGIPIGMMALHMIDDSLLLSMLGIVTLAYVALYIFHWNWAIPNDLRWTYVFGLGAGVLSGAYNAPGLMIIIYGRGRNWSPDEFKSNLQGFFFINSVVTLAARFWGDELTSKVWNSFGYALPAIVLGTMLGIFLSTKTSSRTFDRLVLMLLTLIGAKLLLT